MWQNTMKAMKVQRNMNLRCIASCGGTPQCHLPAACAVKQNDVLIFFNTPVTSFKTKKEEKKSTA